MDFCKNFNERTLHLQKGLLVPVSLVVYKDSSYSFYVKLPTTSFFFKRILSVEKANKAFLSTTKSKKKGFDGVTKHKKYYKYIMTPQQLFEIALIKSFQFPYVPHFNKLCQMLLGTAHSMHIHTRISNK
jgi:ribosomal protein L11